MITTIIIKFHKFYHVHEAISIYFNFLLKSWQSYLKLLIYLNLLVWMRIAIDYFKSLPKPSPTPISLN